MPGYDGTGPQGIGPFGRGLGPCGEGGRLTRRSFFGFGRGMRGRGLGFARWNYYQGDEKSTLDSEKSLLEQQLAAINKRLGDLEKE